MKYTEFYAIQKAAAILFRYLDVENVDHYYHVTLKTHKWLMLFLFSFTNSDSSASNRTRPIGARSKGLRITPGQVRYRVEPPNGWKPEKRKVGGAREKRAGCCTCCVA